MRVVDIKFFILPYICYFFLNLSIDEIQMTRSHVTQNTFFHAIQLYYVGCMYIQARSDIFTCFQRTNKITVSHLSWDDHCIGCNTPKPAKIYYYLQQNLLVALWTMMIAWLLCPADRCILYHLMLILADSMIIGPAQAICS